MKAFVFLAGVVAFLAVFWVAASLLVPTDLVDES